MLHIGLMLTVLHIIYGYENIALNKPTYQSNVRTSKDHIEATFDSSNAVDGLKTDLSAFGGQCVISADGHNTATWWVNLISIHSIHDIRIYYRTDNVAWGSSNGYTVRFLGFYVYVSNTTNRNGAHLCFHDTKYTRATIPAIIDIECLVHGQYIIYYNHRPQSSPYSSQYSPDAHIELCEVEVNGCKKSGYYGSNCSIPCPRNCKHRYCHIETGACQECKPGYQGHHCELPCSLSFYGNFCSEKCGNCSEGMSCNHVNGTCKNGCDVGVYGDECKTPCPVGWHGKNCSEVCNKCDTCDRFMGKCTTPCKTGWKGLYCTEVAEKVDDPEWPSRFYGVLAALCICITIIVALIVYIYITRRRAIERNENGKCKKDNETNTEILDLNIVSGKTDEDYCRTYEELGELALPSDYDHLR